MRISLLFTVLLGAVMVGFLGDGGQGRFADAAAPPSGFWESTPGSMVTPRGLGSRATALLDGRVLITGGGCYTGGWGTCNRAEIYDPAAGTFTAAADMLVHRISYHTATVLPDGRVFVDGAAFIVDTLVLFGQTYNPADNTWTRTLNDANFRSMHTATLLANGKVLLVDIGSAQLYNPASNSYEYAPPPLLAVGDGHTAVRLADGRVLIAGGQSYTCPDGCGALATAQIYDPSSNTWAAANPMSVPRYGLSGALLPDGRIMVAGGRVPVTVGQIPTYDAESTEIYDPTTATWSPGPSMARSRYWGFGNDLMPLGEGLYLAAAGDQGHSSCASQSEIFDSIAWTWLAPEPMQEAHWLGASAPLPGGGALVVGGFNCSGLDAIPVGSERYLPRPADTTPPTLESHLAPLPNANGWNHTDVIVEWSCTDTESGVNPAASDLAPDVLTASGVATATCFDNAGNSTPGAQEVKIDKIAPTVVVTSPIENALYGLGSTLVPTFSCSDDGGSGLTSCTPTQVSTATVGTRAFAVTATDAAGNATTVAITYTVAGKNGCKDGGWRLFLLPVFGNQGQCVGHFAR